MSTSWKATAADLREALRTHFAPQHLVATGRDEWSFLTEVPSTGSPVHDRDLRPTIDDYADSADPHQAWLEALRAWDQSAKVRSIDVLLVRNWRSGRVAHERVAVEIKVSRADFARDTAAKRAPWQVLTHRFAYCAPAGLLNPQDIPEGCWLIEVSERECTRADGRVHESHAGTRVHWNRAVRGRWHTPAAFPLEMTVFFARQASRAAGAIHAATGTGTATDAADSSSSAAPGVLPGHVGGEASAVSAAEVARLRADLVKALARVSTLEGREAANRERVRLALDLVAPLGPQVCADCEAPLRPSVDRYGSAAWRHRTHEQENVCLSARRQGIGATRARRWSAWLVEPAAVRAERERAEDEERVTGEEQAAFRDEFRSPA